MGTAGTLAQLRCGALVAAAMLLLLAMLPADASAQAPSQLWQVPEDGARGSAAGQLSVPLGIGTDPASGDLYVSSLGNARIDVFTAWGEFVRAWGWDVAPEGAPGDTVANQLEVCTTICKAGLEGTGAGQLRGPKGVAVDDNGDVYVYEGATSGEQNLRVQKFAPGGAFLWMIGGGVNKGPTSPGDLCTAAHIVGGDTCGAGVSGIVNGQFSNGSGGNYVAFDPSTGRVLVGDKNRIQQFELDGSYQGEVALPGETVGNLAVDGAGNLYVSYSGKSNAFKLNAAGVQLHTYEVQGNIINGLGPTALAVDLDGSLYAIDDPQAFGTLEQEPRVLGFDPAGQPTILPSESFAAALGLNPRGLATNVVCDGTGESNLYLSAFSSSVSFVSAYGATPCNWPPPLRPPLIEDQYAVSVDSDGATVRAAINPRYWADTAYYVEYGTQECSKGGCSTQPAPPGSKLTDQVIAARLVSGGVFLPGLEPDTTYHYRFVAESTGGGPVFGVGGAEGVDGAEATFTTLPLPSGPVSPDPCPNAQFRTGPSALLADCRAHEMVSPVEKNNGDILPLSNIFGFRAALEQSSLDGEKLTYSSYRAFGDVKGAFLTSQYIASRAPGSGWSTHAISPPRDGPPLIGPGEFDLEYKAFSADLDRAWLLHDTKPLLDPAAPPGIPNLFRRDNGDDSYAGLIEEIPPHLEETNLELELQGVSADGSEAVFRASGNLVAPAPKLPEKQQQVFASGPGGLRFVCVLPGGTPYPGPCSAGTASASKSEGRRSSVSHAISSDGSRIFWTAAGSGPGRIYMRQGNETVAISASFTSAKARFWDAAADGSKALFTIEDDFSPLDENLYEFDVGAAEETLIAGDVVGLLGAGEDASHVYFVSREALDDDAEAGAANLYFYEAGEGAEDGTVTFIAILAAADAVPITLDIPSPVNIEPYKRITRVSPDGRHLAFMSLASLTGRDNIDVSSEEPDAQVYLYDAGADRLVCASCNRTGARPTGRNIENAVNSYWAAGRIPAWTNQLYAPRVLAEDGKRLFFESFDALVASDTNGRRDVYQWEAVGRGTCQGEGSPAFNEVAGGCVTLVSSGESPEDSKFVDASPSGDDLFFVTDSSLLIQDPGLIDIYDARVGGGFPPSSPARPSCEGEACQSPPAPPEDPTPASSALRGGGNLKPRGKARPKRCGKGKRRVVRRGKARCVSKQKGKTAGRQGRPAR